MKKILFLLILTLSFCSLHAQDSILKKNGVTILAKVLEVNLTEIKYRNYGDENGEIYSILKDEVWTIHYANGNTDIINTETPEYDNYFLKGRQDAVRYYRGYKGSGTTVLIVSLVSPVYGLIAAASSSASAPKIKQSDFPNPKLLKNEDYVKGYTKEAKKIKSNKVWENFGIACGAYIAAIAYLLSTM